MCSQRISNFDGIVWLTEVKSRCPRLIRWPIAEKPTPISVPMTRAITKMAKKSCPVNSTSIRAIISAVDSPLSRPWLKTVPQVLRPVTRSTSFRSVPTIAMFATGKFWSASASTARWASA